MPVIIDIDKAPSREFEDGRGMRIKLFDPSNHAKNLDVHINVLKPGHPVRSNIHYHKAIENIYIVLEGEGKIFDAHGTEYPIKAGQAVFFRPGEPPDTHGPYNSGKVPLRFLEIWAPAPDKSRDAPSDEVIVKYIDHSPKVNQ
jgi:mannose-6-phosphate isomerase-like protein (cupin superfamily)